MGSSISIALIPQRRSSVESVMASSLLSLVSLSVCLALVSGQGFTSVGVRGQDITSYCKIEWDITSQECSELNDPIGNAIHNWMFVNQCGFSPRGETCQFVHEDDPKVWSKRGVDITFDGGFVSDIGFVMYPMDGFCRITGDAFTTKQDVTDPDFNYCTLNWIMMDSRITSLYGYRQNATATMCPEMNLADCRDNVDLLARRVAGGLTHNFDNDMAEFLARN